MCSEYIVKQYTLGCDGNVKIILECQFYGVSFVFYPSTPQPWSQVWILKIHFIACIGWSHIFWCVFSILFHNIRGQTRKYLGKETREGRQREHQPDVRQPLEIFKIPSPFACGSLVVWHVSPLNINLKFDSCKSKLLCQRLKLFMFKISALNSFFRDVFHWLGTNFIIGFKIPLSIQRLKLSI